MKFPYRKIGNSGLKRLWPVMLVIALTVPGLLHAGQEITQTLELKAG